MDDGVLLAVDQADHSVADVSQRFAAEYDGFGFGPDYLADSYNFPVNDSSTPAQSIMLTPGTGGLGGFRSLQHRIGCFPGTLAGRRCQDAAPSVQ